MPRTQLRNTDSCPYQVDQSREKKSETMLASGEHLSLTSDRSHSINLSTDKADRTLTLEDSGVGMTRSLSYQFGLIGLI